MLHQPLQNASLQSNRLQYGCHNAVQRLASLFMEPDLEDCKQTRKGLYNPYLPSLQVTFLQTTRRFKACQRAQELNKHPGLTFACLSKRHFIPEIAEALPYAAISQAVIAWMAEEPGRYTCTKRTYSTVCSHSVRPISCLVCLHAQCLPSCADP